MGREMRAERRVGERETSCRGNRPSASGETMCWEKNSMSRSSLQMRRSGCSNFKGRKCQGDVGFAPLLPKPTSDVSTDEEDSSSSSTAGDAERDDSRDAIGIWKVFAIPASSPLRSASSSRSWSPTCLLPFYLSQTDEWKRQIEKGRSSSSWQTISIETSGFSDTVSISRVHFVLFSDELYNIWHETAQELLS